jgi:hypothetical protein
MRAANMRARALSVVIQDIRAAGFISYNAVARELNRRRVPMVSHHCQQAAGAPVKIEALISFGDARWSSRRVTCQQLTPYTTNTTALWRRRRRAWLDKCTGKHGQMDLRAGNKARLIPLALVLLFSLSSHAWAWGDEGHKVFCEIAFRLVQTSTRAEIQRLIKMDAEYQRFSDSCIWPDHPRKRSAEHFVNLARDSHG